jgi:hypothetical protein
MIHTFTKDLFIREKVWSKMNDYERVLLKLIAKEICMQPTLIRSYDHSACTYTIVANVCVSEPLTFHWNGALVTRTFDTYEFLEPVAMCVMCPFEPSLVLPALSLQEPHHSLPARPEPSEPASTEAIIFQ